MWVVIGVIFGIVINHFIIHPIERRKIRKEYFEKYKHLDDVKIEEE